MTWAWDGLDELASLLERDTTLTGRTPLWELLLELVWDRPWLGYGYGAFWNGDKGTYVHLVVRWFPMQAHNGFLNVLVDFGSVRPRNPGAWLPWKLSKEQRRAWTLKPKPTESS